MQPPLAYAAMWHAYQAVRADVPRVAAAAAILQVQQALTLGDEEDAAADDDGAEGEAVKREARADGAAVAGVGTRGCADAATLLGCLNSLLVIVNRSHQRAASAIALADRERYIALTAARASEAAEAAAEAEAGNPAASGIYRQRHIPPYTSAGARRRQPAAARDEWPADESARQHHRHRARPRRRRGRLPAPPEADEDPSALLFGLSGAAPPEPAPAAPEPPPPPETRAPPPAPPARGAAEAEAVCE